MVKYSQTLVLFIDDIFVIIKENHIIFIVQSYYLYRESLSRKILKEIFGRLELTGELDCSNSVTFLDLKISLNN